MSKVCLIIPNSAFLLDERVFPFLGTLKVAAAWKQQGVNIDLLDLGGIENYLDVVEDYINSNTDLSFIGVTATTPQLPSAYQIGKLVKEKSKNKLVLGGPHVTLMNTARLREYNRGVYGERAERNIAKLETVFDVLACGDGELMYDEIQRAFKKNIRIIDADNRKSPLFLTNTSFSKLPNPDRDLIDLDSYHYYIEGERATSLISQLGCPFQCLVGTERIPTEKGLLQIKDIVNSNNLQHEAKELKIKVTSEKQEAETSHGLNQGMQPTVKLNLRNGLSLTGHPDHKIRIVRDGQLIWEKLSLIGESDHAVIQAGSKVYPKEYLKLQYNGYKDRSINSGNFQAQKHVIPTTLNEDLAWLMGFFIGDGSYSDRGLTFAVIDKTKDKLLKAVKNVFNYDCRIYRIKSTEKCEQAWIYSVELLQFFEKVLDIEKGNKYRVPELIYQSPKSVVESFIQGLMDADAYCPDNSADYLTTHSEKLAKDFAQLLIYIGICPSIYKIKNKNRNCFYYRVAKTKYDIVPHEFGAYWDKKGKPKFRKSYAGKSGIRKFVLKEIDENHELYNEDWFFVPVQNIEHLKLNQRLFDLTVPSTQSYISSGFISHNCTFCSGRNSPFLRNIRTRSVQSIVDELEHLYLTYGYKAFMFYDDELNVNKEMVNLMYSIADLGQKHGVEWKLRGFTKAELFTENQAKAMYEAGFRVLLTGFESGDPRILKNIRKRATRDENTRCVEIAKKYNLKVKALMSMGHAGESEESIRNTEKWLLEVQPDDFDCTVITTYPGSPYFDDAVYDGKKYVFTSKDTGDKLYQTNIDYTAEVDYYKGVPGEYQAHVWTDYLTTEELANLRDETEENVRKKLNIPYNPASPARKYEHSMGSSRNLPDWILRKSESDDLKKKVNLKVI